MYWSDGTPVAGQQFAYGFDDIGNRRTASRGGDQSGANLRQASYTVNNLNELNQRTVPGYVDVIGTAASNANVMVKTTFSYQNWYGMAYRKGNYFRAESTVDTSSIGAWLSIDSIAVLPGGASPDIQSNVVGNVFVPKTPELFVYDLDGNLTTDGRWNYTWDAENRLVKMAVNTPIGPPLSLQFEYDAKGRRIRKQVWQNTTWTGTPSTDLRFVYDGWNLVATLNQQLSPLNNFLWGLDLSGTPQGAGGVGGLLSEWDSSTINNQPSAHFAAFDGNGNLAALVSAADGTISAQYEYGPFGEVIRATGPMAKASTFRFSTKYQDAESDLVYYGFRYFSTSTGRWLGRDPHWEQGSIGVSGKGAVSFKRFRLVAELGNPNVFNMLRNALPNDIDILGLCGSPCKCGEDVTLQVYMTLQDIAAAYNSASFSTKWRAKHNMFTINDIESWDIWWLKYGFTSDNWNLSCPKCKNTVEFEGQCVNLDELNYVMFGWGMALCDESPFVLASLGEGLQERSILDRLAGKPYDTADVIRRKVGFAAYEYFADTNFGTSGRLPPSLAWPEDCPLTHQFPHRMPNIKDWNWRPLRMHFGTN